MDLVMGHGLRHFDQLAPQLLNSAALRSSWILDMSHRVPRMRGCNLRPRDFHRNPTCEAPSAMRDWIFAPSSSGLASATPPLHITATVSLPRARRNSCPAPQIHRSWNDSEEARSPSQAATHRADPEQSSIFQSDRKESQAVDMCARTPKRRK